MLQFLRDNSDDWVLTNVGDGVVNHVFRVSLRSDEARSIIVKYGSAYVKVSFHTCRLQSTATA